MTVPLSEAGSCVAAAPEAGSCGASVASEAGSCGVASVSGDVASGDVATAAESSDAESSADAVSVSTGSTEPWSMLETWSEVASALPEIDCVMIASC